MIERNYLFGGHRHGGLLLMWKRPFLRDMGLSGSRGGK
jgi:hypothetical protein